MPHDVTSLTALSPKTLWKHCFSRRATHRVLKKNSMLSQWLSVAQQKISALSNQMSANTGRSDRVASAAARPYMTTQYSTLPPRASQSQNGREFRLGQCHLRPHLALCFTPDAVKLHLPPLRRILVTRMDESSDRQQSVPQRLLINPFRIGPSARALAGFYDQLASMLQAGLTVGRALDSLSEQAGSGGIRRRIPAMKQHISDGGDAAGAFALFPDIFDPVHVAMIRAAERGGQLDETLKTLSETCERRARLSGTFITAVIYPVLLLHFALFAIPFIESVRGGADTSYWQLAWPRFAVFYGVLFALFIGPRVLRQFGAASYALDMVRSFLPLISGVSEKLAVSRMARAIEALYGSGMTLVEALPTAADACGDELFRRDILRMVPMMTAGMPLSEAMRTVDGFPAAFVNMIATGEEGGQLSKMLANAADYYEDEAETTLKRVATVLPVIIYICVAVYIAFHIVENMSSMMNERMQLPGSS